MTVPRFNIVDGGYLTYVYSRMWAQVAWPPDYIRDALVMMDDFKTIRERIDPSYKSARREKRANNPNLYRDHQRVTRFRETVRDDPRMTFVKVNGLEADDLVVLGNWVWRQQLRRKPKVLGVDKDLLQTRGIKLYDHKGQRIKLQRFQKSLPKTLQSNSLIASQIPLVLSILGDKSDSIPRLLPSRDLGWLWRVLWDKNTTGWKEANRRFNRAFRQNLYATILPHPTCFGLSEMETFNLVAANNWKPKILLPQLLPALQEEVESWPIATLQKASMKKKRPLNSRYVELGKSLRSSV